MEEAEVWKDIKGFEGYYQVSNFGNIKSLSRTILNHGVNPFTSKEKILKGKLVDKKRLYVNLYSADKRTQQQVSVLVAIEFLGHVPNGHITIVDHIDNNPLNNRADNLQLTTQRHNSSKDQKNRSSKYIGVFWDKARLKWESRIWINGKKHFLGRFENEEKASEAYQNKLSTLN